MPWSGKQRCPRQISLRCIISVFVTSPDRWLRTPIVVHVLTFPAGNARVGGCHVNKCKCSCAGRDVKVSTGDERSKRLIPYRYRRTKPESRDACLGGSSRRAV